MFFRLAYRKRLCGYFATFLLILVFFHSLGSYISANFSGLSPDDSSAVIGELVGRRREWSCESRPVNEADARAYSTGGSIMKSVSTSARSSGLTVSDTSMLSSRLRPRPKRVLKLLTVATCSPPQSVYELATSLTLLKSRFLILAKHGLTEFESQQ